MHSSLGSKTTRKQERRSPSCGGRGWCACGSGMPVVSSGDQRARGPQSCQKPSAGHFVHTQGTMNLSPNSWGLRAAQGLYPALGAGHRPVTLTTLGGGVLAAWVALPCSAARCLPPSISFQGPVSIPLGTAQICDLAPSAFNSPNYESNTFPVQRSSPWELIFPNMPRTGGFSPHPEPPSSSTSHG